MESIMSTSPHLDRSTNMSLPNAKPVPRLVPRGQEAFAGLPNLDEILSYDTSSVQQSVAGGFSVGATDVSQDMPGKDKSDTRRQQPTQDCWHGSQGRGQDSMAHADLGPPPFPHRLRQAAREPLGPVRGGQPSDNSPPA